MERQSHKSGPVNGENGRTGVGTHLEPLRIVLPGAPTIADADRLLRRIKKIGRDAPVILDFKDVTRIDSSVVALLKVLERGHPAVTFVNISDRFDRLRSLFERPGDAPCQRPHRFNATRFMEDLGQHLVDFLAHGKRYLVLLADETYHSFHYLVRRRGVYPGEISNQLYQMGYKSFPIVCLISFLVGITIAVTSAQQLRNFGADIYLADLVGYGMIRELVPLMTGIILAGKVGAAITAEIGSMKVLDEIDALRTMGVVPEKFLMVPRLLAMSLAVPPITAVADFVGIAAGMLVSWGISDIPPIVFYNRMISVVDLGDFLNGLTKTIVFGWIIVITSGYKGFSVTHGATGVGIATTQSVVLSISLIILTDCAFALALY